MSKKSLRNPLIEEVVPPRNTPQTQEIRPEPRTVLAVRTGGGESRAFPWEAFPEERDNENRFEKKEGKG